jgi:hypothetical protein
MSPFKILLTVITLTLLGIGAAFSLYSLIGPKEDNRKLDLIPVTIENLKLNIPRRYFRGGAPPAHGVSERIDLMMLYPDMEVMAAISVRVEDAPKTELLVFMSIQRNDGVIDPSERVQDLYGRFLESATFDSPGGLLMKRFNADSPYGDEELFIAPPDGRVFAARCRKPEKKDASIGETCLWRFRQNGADIQIRFSPALLPHWEEMALALANRLKEWEGR